MKDSAEQEVLCHQCPKCRAIGTFRCYPEIAEAPERWLCKWCGYYWSEKLGEHQCVPDSIKHVWMFKEDAANPNEKTPMEIFDGAHRWLLHAMGVS